MPEKGTQTAGLVVNTNFSGKGRMMAQINGQSYPLTGKSNFISLPPYAEYKVELMNDKTQKTASTSLPTAAAKSCSIRATSA